MVHIRNEAYANTRVDHLIVSKHGFPYSMQCLLTYSRLYVLDLSGINTSYHQVNG